MLTIICGEDSISSYNYYSSLKKSYLDKNYEIRELSANDLENINLWMGEAQLLFSQKQVFFTQNINKKLSKKLNLKINKIVEGLIKDKKIEIISWEEDISSRFLKFPKGTKIKEFKPNQNIFKLQDALYPGNFNNFVKMLNELTKTIDENFIFIMLARHLRNLVLIKTEQESNKLQQWQLYKLKNQASKWETEKLINFYDSFHRLDVNQKTSSTPYGIIKSLDILACYYL